MENRVSEKMAAIRQEIRDLQAIIRLMDRSLEKLQDDVETLETDILIERYRYPAPASTTTAVAETE